MIDLKLEIEKLEITPETVSLVISSDADEDNFWEFSAALHADIKELKNQGRASMDLRIIFLGKGITIAALDEEEMGMWGWQRIKYDEGDEN